MTVFTCDVCKYSTQRRYNFIKHEKTTKHAANVSIHNLHGFECTMCHKKFRDRYNLQRHCKRKIQCGIYQDTNQIVNHGADQDAGQVANTDNNQGANTNINQVINTDGGQMVNNNGTINNTTIYNINFSELKELATCKDDKHLMTHIQHNVEDVMNAQGRFNLYAKEAAIISKSKLEKEQKDEERFAKAMEDDGEEYTMENIDVDNYRIDLDDIVIKTFFDRNNKHISLFREPDVDNAGRWLVKHMCKAFDPQILVNLVVNCPYKNHFTPNIEHFEELDRGRMANAYRESMRTFLKALDSRRNGYNHRSRD